MKGSHRLLGLLAVIFISVPAGPLTAQDVATQTPEITEPPPVQWRPWSEEVFARARKEQKGVFLTIVHPGCRPCDVSDAEVYEDPAVRQLIDRLWIPVRVDSTERPDIDARYRLALAILTRGGSSGYPVTAFLFPTGEAIWVDTFIPARGREARPGLRDLLRSSDRLWKQRFEEARGNAVAVQSAFEGEGQARRKGVVERTVVSAIVDGTIARSDRQHGGYGAPPRRENAFAARLVLLASKRREDPGLLKQAVKALHGPVKGSVYDRLEGGFHKAPRMADWSVPYFGKDLMINSAYLTALADAITLTGDPALREAASRTVDFILTRLRADEGGFYSAQLSAARGSDEASYYAWETTSVKEALSVESVRWAELLYGFRENGEELLGLPHRFTLKDLDGVEAAVNAAGLDPAEIPRRTEEISMALSGLRAGKTEPEVVPMRFLDSSAMACSALLAASRALDRPDAADAALEVLDSLMKSGPLEDGLPHGLHAPGNSPVLMADQAHLGNALLDGYEQTGASRYLDGAARVAQGLLDRFDSTDGAFYDVLEQKKAAGYVRIRRKVFLDSSRPSPLAEVSRLLLRLGSLTGESSHLRRAEKALSWAIGRLPALDATGTTLAMVIDSLLSGHVVIKIGQGDEGRTLRRAALGLYEPARVILTTEDGEDGAEICLGDVCRQGLHSADALESAMDELRSAR